MAYVMVLSHAEGSSRPYRAVSQDGPISASTARSISRVGADDVTWARTSFPRAIKQKTGRGVLLLLLFKSRAHRRPVNARVMKDIACLPRRDPKTFPFDASHDLRASGAVDRAGVAPFVISRVFDAPRSACGGRRARAPHPCSVPRLSVLAEKLDCAWRHLHYARMAYCRRCVASADPRACRLRLVFLNTSPLPRG